MLVIIMDFSRTYQKLTQNACLLVGVILEVRLALFLGAMIQLTKFVNVLLLHSRMMDVLVCLLNIMHPIKLIIIENFAIYHIYLVCCDFTI